MVIMLLHFSWSNFVIGIILYFRTTKPRTIELGLELILELEIEKQSLELELEKQSLELELELN